MSTSFYYRMRPRDWDDGTMCLTLEEEAALLRVCNSINSRRQPIPDDEATDREMAARCRVSLRKWRTLKAGLIAKGKLIARDGCLENEQAMGEVAWRLRQEKAGESSPKTERKSDENEPKTARKSSENPAKTERKSSENGRAPIENQGLSGSHNKVELEEENKYNPPTPKGGEADDLVDLAGGDPSPPPAAPKPDWPVPKSTATERPWEADADFCKLWLHWPEPSRKRSSVTKAWAEWRRAIKRNDRQALMAALGAFLRSPDARKDGGQFVTGLHTFLKEDRAASFIEAGRPVGTFERPCAANGRGRRPDEEEDDLLAAQREYIGGWAS